MTYRLPGPSVTEILTRANQDLASANLLPCIVGPLYRVVKNKQIAASIPGSLPVTYGYPFLDPGSTVDYASVKLVLTNATAKYFEYTMASGSPIFVAGASSISVGSADFVAAGVKPGDVVKVDNNGGSYTVDTVAITSLKFTTPILYTVPQSGQKFKVYRNYDSYTTVSGFTADSGGVQVTALADSNGKPFTACSLGLSYRALRADKTGFYSVSNLDQLKSDMEISKDNLLGFVLGDIMLPASGGTEILAYITTDSSKLAFDLAYSDLQTRKETYLIVPLSTDSSILGDAVSHVDTMSEPAVSYFRAAILNAVLSVTKTVSTTTFTAP